jgi:nicotinamidase-related amidase
MSLSLEKGRTALLVMDYQNTIVANYAAAGPQALEPAARALAAARKAGLAVIHVVIGFRPGYPEVSPRNKMFGGLTASGRFQPGTEGAAVHAAVAPLPGELVATKHRVSAFAGSDLEMLLRAGGIDSLVLAGIATSGVVLSTLRQAADLDFRLTVLKDACLDADPAVHACLVDKVFPRQAEVVDVAAFEAALEGR